MGRTGWVIAIVVAIGGGLLWLFAGFGAFDTPEDLARRGDLLDGGVLEDPSFVDGGADGDDGGPSEVGANRERGENSLGLSGRAVVSLHNFAMDDKEDRNVLRARKVTGSVDIDALQRGVYRMRKATADGVEVTLYRDATGRVSITHALEQSPPTVRSGLQLPPKEEPEQGPWLIQIGPVVVTDATLTLAFVEKPVQFHVDRAKVFVRRGAEDDGPMIFIEEVEGVMTKPKPLPKPVRIAWANGVVQLHKEPLVRLDARACVARDEILARAVVPARKTPVELTVDTSGFMGALARMGLKIASKRKSGQLHYHHGPVKFDGGPGCDDPETAAGSEASEEPSQKQQEHAAESKATDDKAAHDEPVGAKHVEEKRADEKPLETKHEKNKERREEDREERREERQP